MSALADYTGGNAGLARPTAAAGQGAASTADTSFGGKVWNWSDLPAESQALDDGRGTYVTGVVDLGTGYARTINGVPHQMLNAFRAYLDRLILVTAARPLTRQPNGTMKPSGAWFHHEGTVYRPVTPPVRTRGTVPPGTPSQDGPNGSGPALPAAQRAGARNFAFLPAPVRATAIKSVPEPTTWLGEIIQWPGTTEGRSSRQALSTLRMDYQRAVVIVAERGAQGSNYTAAELAALDWQVTQMTYDLPADRRQLSGNDRTQLPGAGR